MLLKYYVTYKQSEEEEGKLQGVMSLVMRVAPDKINRDYLEGKGKANPVPEELQLQMGRSEVNMTYESEDESEDNYALYTEQPKIGIRDSGRFYPPSVTAHQSSHNINNTNGGGRPSQEVIRARVVAAVKDRSRCKRRYTKQHVNATVIALTHSYLLIFKSRFLSILLQVAMYRGIGLFALKTDKILESEVWCTHA